MTTRVLIGQLEDIVAAGTAAILRESAHFEVEVLDPNSEEGLAEVSSRFDVVIAGYEAAVALGEGAAGTGRIVALTSANTERQVRLAMERGLRGYLMTGCKANELVEAVRAVAVGRTALSDMATSRLARSLASPGLTARELEVLRLLALGMSNKAIANLFSRSIGTVKTHVKSIIAKLHARSRTEAATIALRRGLVSLPEETEVRSRRRSGAGVGALRSDSRSRSALLSAHELVDEVASSAVQSTTSSEGNHAL